MENILGIFTHQLAATSFQSMAFFVSSTVCYENFFALAALFVVFFVILSVLCAPNSCEGNMFGARRTLRTTTDTKYISGIKDGEHSWYFYPSVCRYFISVNGSFLF